MNPTWEVAVYHFKREVFKKSYIFTLLSLPFFLAFTIGLGQLIAASKTSNIKIGVVDPAGICQTLSLPGREDSAEFILFDSEEAAKERLEVKSDPLTAVYIFNPDYPKVRDVEMFFTSYPPSESRDYFADIVRFNLLTGQPEAATNRVIDGQTLTVRASSVNREFPADNPTADLFIPLMLAVIYIFTIFPVAGIMIGALGDEKVNRTIEVVITSISPKTMIQGKVLAVSAIALMQVTIWVIFLILAVWISGSWFDIEFFQDITVNWRDVTAIVVLTIPAFIFYSAVLITLGSLINDPESLSQASGLIFFPLFLPLYVIPILIESPDGVLALIISILPFTSVQTVGLQSLFMEVPTWRIAVSTATSWASALGMTWLASRAFRMGMLRYGQRIRIKELFRKAAAAN